MTQVTGAGWQVTHDERWPSYTCTASPSPPPHPCTLPCKEWHRTPSLNTRQAPHGVYKRWFISSHGRPSAPPMFSPCSKPHGGVFEPFSLRWAVNWPFNEVLSSTHHRNSPLTVNLQLKLRLSPLRAAAICCTGSTEAPEINSINK